MPKAKGMQEESTTRMSRQQGRETAAGQTQEHRGEQQGGQKEERGLERRTPNALSPSSASPFSFMRRFSEEMDRLFEDFGFGPSFSGFGGSLMPRSEFGQAAWAPQIEMFERDNKLVVRADLPGLSKEDIKVEVANDYLTIEGERRREHEETKEGRYRSERSYGHFYRSIPLPAGVDSKDVNATFHDGVLEVTMPAPPSQEARGRRIYIG